ncbi:hypothetical protein JCM11641_006909 [Rhodosporidiobolus odoratus]
MADKSRVSLMLHGAGLIVVYSLYGLLQEKIMRSSTYGPNDEHFTSSSLLICFNRIFSVAVGLAILFYKSKQQPEHGGFAQRFKPASPYFAYASVAVFNFLSTSCQYQALRYVSYTTQSLAKTSKMIPVLVVGALVWKKKHLTREWVAGGVILAGCATYLFSTPPTPHGSHGTAGGNGDEDWFNGLAGTFFLVGYLFFDGLVSTTQEKVFGKNPSSSDPFGPDSPVLDQMVWTNIFAFLIAVVMSIASTATGGFWNNLELLLTSGSLLWDVCVFSAASAFGLIILLNTIASFGALTSSLIMTIRQFLSILINAGIFGNFASVSMTGWTGVFWVASGIWIKINKKYDPPKQPKVVFDIGDNEEEQSMLNEKSQPGSPLHEDDLHSTRKPNKIQQYFFQYAVPCLVPIAVALVLSPFMAPPSETLGSASSPLSANANASIQVPATAHTGATVAPAQLGAVDAPGLDGLPPIVGSTTPAQSQQGTGNTDLTEVATSADVKAAAELGSAEAKEAAELAVAIEGGSWDSQLHDAVSPACKAELVTKPYKTDLRTGFVSYPRSGNSYLRSLIERATGYQTSSIYCDQALRKTFIGECDHSQKFFVKTHFPALPRVVEAETDRWKQYYRQFDQVVHVVRNPLDALVSWFHLSHTPRTPEGYQNHEAKLNIEKFGNDQYKGAILDLADRWRRHTTYWMQAPVLTHQLRYEDLKAQPIPNTMSLLSFLLPDEDLPPLQDVACIAEHHENLQAYHSRRASDFASWDKFEPALRTQVLKIVRRPFCVLGYQRVLLNARGDDPAVQAEMKGFCDHLTMEDDEYDEHTEVWGLEDPGLHRMA